MCTSVSRTSHAMANNKQPKLLVQGKWTATPDSAMGLGSFEDVAQEIISNQAGILQDNSPCEIMKYINAFNTTWTGARLKKNLISSPSKQGPSVIQFSSFSKCYAWLSNFFKTLIYDKSKERILPHIEAGYVAFKAESENNLKLARDVVLEMDPKIAKQMGVECSVLDSQKRICEMSRLVTLKFEQNSTLTSLLKDSKEISLEEHTRDAFWGTAHGSSGSNNLGKILEEVRANASYSSSFT